MNAKTKILIVEHDPNDIEMIERELKNGKVNYVSEIVERRKEYENALHNFQPDVILSDYSLPSFSGPEAFKLKEITAPHTPFIFVSGTVGEENSIELIKRGVTDFVLKERLFSLPVKLVRALNEAKEKSDRLQTHLALIQSEHRLARAQQVAHLGSWELDIATGIAIWSEEGCSIYGFDTTAKRQTYDEWASYIHPDDFEFVMQLLKSSRQSFSGNSFDHRIVRKDGSIRHIHSESKFEFDANNNPVRIYGIAQDITERKEAENEISLLNDKLENRVQERTAELTEANKALEGFSYSVSHDLRSPLRAVMSFSKIIQEDYGTKMDAKTREMFGYIDDNSKRMGIIIEDLLKLAKYGKKKINVEPVDMTLLVNGIWSNIGRSTPHKAELQLSELPNIQVDMSMMQQVIVNLLSNAIKYSSKKEQPLIKVWSVITNEDITFYFKDNGAGFDMESYHRLFGAFQRLHSANEFEGTGVGLALVKRIIEKHKGTVGAEGEVGEGATFYFTIPLNQ